MVGKRAPGLTADEATPRRIGLDCLPIRRGGGPGAAPSADGPAPERLERVIWKMDRSKRNAEILPDGRRE